MNRIVGLVNIRRLAIAAPVLALLGLALWLVLPDGDAATPRAVLVDTPAAGESKPGVQKGQLARDFIARGPDGDEVRLSDLRGQPTIVNFWATWCTSCLVEMPAFKELQQEVGPDRLNVLAVNAGEDSATAQAFLDELDAPAFHVGMDPSLVVADAYAPSGLRPVTHVNPPFDSVEQLYPYQVDGQRVDFCVYREGPYRPAGYYARIVTKGEYVVEPAVIQSQRSPDSFNLTPADTITIR